MKTYEFTLKFSFPDEDHIDGMDELVERLARPAATMPWSA